MGAFGGAARQLAAGSPACFKQAPANSTAFVSVVRRGEPPARHAEVQPRSFWWCGRVCQSPDEVQVCRMSGNADDLNRSTQH